MLYISHKLLRLATLAVAATGVVIAAPGQNAELDKSADHVLYVVYSSPTACWLTVGY
jgi:hypothetical protein